MNVVGGVDENARPAAWFAFSQGFDSASGSFVDALGELDRLWQEQSSVPVEQIKRVWENFSPDHTLRFLMELIKQDQLQRLNRGLSFDLYEYLAVFDQIRGENSRIVSLAYSEFCMRQESGESLSVEEFCEKYQDWRHSIRQQLDLHRLLSIPSNELTSHDQARHFPRVGETVGQFELQRELGRGGAARVYLARDLRLSRRPVALKISGDRSKEPEILARLEHDNIVPVLSVHDAPDGLRLICMPFRGDITLDRMFSLLYEYVGRQPRRASDFRNALLYAASTEDEPNQPTQAAESGWNDFPGRGTFEDALAWIGWKLALALEHAHSLEVYHRDIKPANILISRRSGPQLLDFNMARDPDAVAQVEERIRGGTLPYMAPEQLGAFLDASLWQEIGPRSDLYSLGLVIKELAIGKRVELPLSPRMPLLDQVRAILRARDQKWNSVRSENPSLSGAFDAVLEKLMQFSPAQRYQKASHLAEDFERIIAGKPLKWAVNRSYREQFRLAVRPIRKYAVVLAMICGLWYGWPRRQPSQGIIVEGISAAELKYLKNQQFGDALTSFRNNPPSSPDTMRDLLKYAAWIKTDPSNPDAQELMKSLIPRADFDQAMMKAEAVLGKNEELDFIAVYRDYCAVANRPVESGGKPTDLEWQRVEQRFLTLQQQWPDDIRLAGFLAYFASMRSDFKMAVQQAEKGLALAEKSGIHVTDAAYLDLLQRKIQYCQLEAASLQAKDQPQEAQVLYSKTLDSIKIMRQSRPESQLGPELKSFLADIEVISNIGLGDVLMDLKRTDESLRQFEATAVLLSKIETDFIVPARSATLREFLQFRINNLRSFQTGVTNPEIVQE